MGTTINIEGEGVKFERVFEPNGNLNTVDSSSLGLSPGVEILQIVAQTAGGQETAVLSMLDMTEVTRAFRDISWNKKRIGRKQRDLLTTSFQGDKGVGVFSVNNRDFNIVMQTDKK